MQLRRIRTAAAHSHLLICPNVQVWGIPVSSSSDTPPHTQRQPCLRMTFCAVRVNLAAPYVALRFTCEHSRHGPQAPFSLASPDTADREGAVSNHDAGAVDGGKPG